MDAGIREISLAGFQTFAELTRIPIRRLTFLLGPNSAGKSAVEDALLIFRELYSHRYNPVHGDSIHPWANDGWGRGYRLKSHWRKTSEALDGFVDEMRIGVGFRISTDVEGALGSYLPKDPSTHMDLLAPAIEAAGFRQNNYEDIELVTRFRASTHDWFGSGPRCNVSLHVNGLQVTEIRGGERVGINLRHPVLRQVGLRTDFQEVARKYSKDVVWADGWLWFISDYVGGRQRLDDGFLSLAINEPTSPVGILVKELVEIYENLFQIILGNMFDIELPLVSASRVIPSEKDLAFVFEREDYDLHAASCETFGLAETGAREYRELAASLATCLRDTKQAFELPNDYPRGMRREALAESVNRMLTDYLFIERGYRLDLDYRVMLMPDEFQEARENGLFAGDQARSFTLLVRLFLIDAEGRRFPFTDVGSGLGYVLPVLCAAFDTSPVAIIQQPELHLHPALQACLGDVLLEATADGKQLIVETHSEHVLLRILKRIRQSGSGKIPSASLSIHPDEMSVVYFEPTSAGITSAKRLRVSSDGDFIDRWPRGFFPERDQELFDE